MKRWLLAVGLLLAGCYTTTPLRGQSPAQLKQDDRECAQEARLAGRAAEAEARVALAQRSAGDKVAAGVMAGIVSPLPSGDDYLRSQAFLDAYRDEAQACMVRRGYLRERMDTTRR
jgi:hypothetical protein